jgi:hypothetical protein
MGNLDKALDITPEVVRQHLAHILKQGLIEPCEAETLAAYREALSRVETLSGRVGNFQHGARS